MNESPDSCFDLVILHSNMLKYTITQMNSKVLSEYDKNLMLLQLYVLNSIFEQIDFNQFVDFKFPNIDSEKATEVKGDREEWEKLFQDVVYQHVYKGAETIAKKADREIVKILSYKLMSTIIRRSPNKFYDSHFGKFLQSRGMNSYLVSPAVHEKIFF